MTNFCSQCGKPVQQSADFCTNCGVSLKGKCPAKVRWDDKRERVLSGGNRNSRSKWIFMTLGLALLGGWLYVNLPEGGHPIIKASPVVTEPLRYSGIPQQMVPVTVKEEAGRIVLLLDLVQKKNLVRFNYGDTENGLPMLAYITGEGKVVTAVSMCEPCNSTAFHIKGDKMICNSCGSTWELNDLEAVSGSCGRYPPDAVPNTVVGNEIQIDEQIVARWQRRI